MTQIVTCVEERIFSFVAELNCFIQGDYSGRLLHYSPEGKTTCIADNLFYANGVELTSDESAVLVNETCLQKVTKIWLKGPKVSINSLHFLAFKRFGVRYVIMP